MARGKRAHVGHGVVSLSEGPPKEASTSDAAAQQPKAQRLAEDRVAALPVGANLVEIDGKACTHEVAWPPGQEGSSRPPATHAGTPARVYPFKLDPFQQTAINSLEAGHSVLVAAHTSAGKTVIAEYAFAMGLRDKGRVIYTSPLKALSNQKYRELKEEFGDVGLMTGDVTIDENASCLVMTTEILRSMLYRGSEVVREVQLLVYDEIHYLRDKERGVVWEESIIMAPKGCRFAFLSATIPNAKEFASWVAKVHGSPCHVVYTDYRPTPLEHYIFPAGSQDLYNVVAAGGVFDESAFQKAIEEVQQVAADGKAAGKVKGAKGGQMANGRDADKDKSDVFRIVKMIVERNYDPCIVFSFSKADVEKRASQEMLSLDLTDAVEKEMIKAIFDNAVACLSEEDRKLPQVNTIAPMLKRGVGMHHSGMLPIIKEAVEILFQEGLLKVLFATETFSTGLNMPAKTVIFTSARKWDGGQFRWVRSGEYIQMSGRAGRRGLDDKGIVILMLDAKMEAAVAREMIKGAPDTMVSEFHLGYNMLLNLYRLQQEADTGNPEVLMASSFRQYQLERSLPVLEARAASLQARAEAFHIPHGEDAAAQYLAGLERLAQLQSQLRGLTHGPKQIVKFLSLGRLVRVLPESGGRPEGHPLPDFGKLSDEEVTAAASVYGEATSGLAALAQGGVWGVLIETSRTFKEEGTTAKPDDAEDAAAGPPRRRDARVLAHVLLNTPPEGPRTALGPRGLPLLRLLPPGAKRAKPEVVAVELCQLQAVSTVRTMVPADLRAGDERTAVLARAAEAVKRLAQGSGGNVPLLGVDEMGVPGKEAKVLEERIREALAALAAHPMAGEPAELREAVAAMQAKQGLLEEAKVAARELKDAKSLILKEELRCMERVLRQLGFVDEGGMVTKKGRVAASITAANELVLAELVLDGAFDGMSQEQLLAALSCFVCQEKTDRGVKLSEDLERVLLTVQDAARKVARKSIECKVALDEDEFVAGFSPVLMEAAAAWHRGVRFADLMIMYKDKVHEGSIVRIIRRLEELLRQLSDAVRLELGNPELATRFDDARLRIKRDIIFAASLYL